jgi:prepilin-type N-terminal cleavage/methylation domain-containing protein
MQQTLQRWQSRRRYKRDSGFTIIELLIVIIVIAILATLVIVAYNGVQAKAADVQHKADQATVYKAILVARENTGQTLAQITGSNCSNCSCTSGTNNPDGLEPRQLPKSNGCWTLYYHDLAAIGAAAGQSLDSLRDGDARGNPAFTLDENEGEGGGCNTDSLRWWGGNGVTTAGNKAIPLFSSACL